LKAQASPLHAIGPALTGLFVFLGGGILTALLAARVLPPVDYTIYAAFSSLWGIAVLATAGAVEMETTLRTSNSRSSSSFKAPMLFRAWAIWAFVNIALWIPVREWQERLLSEDWPWWLMLTLLGSAAVFTGAVLRGASAGSWLMGILGASNAATGLVMLGGALLFLGLGVDALAAIISATTVCWYAGLTVLWLGMLRRRRYANRALTSGLDPRFPSGHAAHGVRKTSTHGGDSSTQQVDSSQLVNRGSTRGQEVPFQTSWMVAASLLMSAALLSVPAILRWHVIPSNAVAIADAQLLVSLSRLSSTIVLGLVPVMMSAMSRSEGGHRPARHRGLRGSLDVARRWLMMALSLSVAALAVLALLGPLLLPWLTGRPLTISASDAALATTPTLLLAPALVLVALANVRRRFGIIVLAWTLALIPLLMTWWVEPVRGLTPLLVLIWISAAMPAIVLVAGLAWRRQRPRELRRSSQIALPPVG
jgi:hypothetical protein